MHPIILDTDIGSDVDDALALAYALTLPDIELLAVTTVSGNAHVRANIARRILELSDHSHIPVYAGSDEPIGGGPGFVWFGTEGDGILSDDVPEEEPRCAVTEMASLLQTRADVELVCIGPLTNIAHLLASRPDLASAIRRLTIMGGYFGRVPHIPSACSASFDYNLRTDPQATFMVLRSRVPIQLVTMDVTLNTWITTDDIANLEQKGSALQQTLARACRIWTPIMHTILGGFGVRLPENIAAFLHDPLAIACAASSEVCGFAEMNVEIVRVGSDLRTYAQENATDTSTRMRCTTRLRDLEFRRSFMDQLLTSGR